VSTSPVRALWIDSPVASVTSPAFWRWYSGLGMQHAQLMCERMKAGLDFLYDADELRTVASLASDHDISIGLTVWMEPDLEYLAKVRDELPELLVAARAVSLEAELEVNWTPKRLRGFDSMDHAGDALVELMHDQSETLDVTHEGTSFTGHVENGKLADVSRYLRRYFPQAYSVRKRREKGVDVEQEWDGRTGPGGMQRWTIDRALTIPRTERGPVICAGLAAYDQKWPGRTVHEAMQTAYDAALAYDPPEIRWWSSKNVLRDDAVEAFLRGLPNERRA
jgi:hypothetical protein